MARQKKAIKYIRHSINSMVQREEWWQVSGMIQISSFMGNITEDEAETLMEELEEAYDNLDC
jgi:hypothetical protein